MVGVQAYCGDGKAALLMGDAQNITTYDIFQYSCPDSTVLVGLSLRSTDSFNGVRFICQYTPGVSTGG